jgi:hypothetical protein
MTCNGVTLDPKVRASRIVTVQAASLADPTVAGIRIDRTDSIRFSPFTNQGKRMKWSGMGRKRKAVAIAGGQTHSLGEKQWLFGIANDVQRRFAKNTTQDQILCAVANDREICLPVLHVRQQVLLW